MDISWRSFGMAVLTVFVAWALDDIKKKSVAGAIAAHIREHYYREGARAPHIDLPADVPKTDGPVSVTRGDN
jgi:hypothetical protein